MARTRSRTVVVRQANVVRTRYQHRRRVSAVRRHFGSSKLSAAMLLGMGVGLKNAYSVGNYAPADSFNQYTQRLLLFYTGFAPWNPPGTKWQFAETRFGLAPLATGIIVHYLANATGLNRGLAKLTKSLPVQI